MLPSDDFGQMAESAHVDVIPEAIAFDRGALRARWNEGTVANFGLRAPAPVAEQIAGIVAATDRVVAGRELLEAEKGIPSILHLPADRQSQLRDRPELTIGRGSNDGRRRVALEAAARVGLALREGVYACLPGPSYETPAEIRMLRTLGADVVGMSTVPEAIVARHAGIEVLAFALVTNAAAGITGAAITHEEVIEAGREAGLRLGLLIEAIIGRVGVTRGE